MQQRNEHTSKRIARLASKVLSNPKSTPVHRKIAASALAQARDRSKKSKR